MCKKNHLIWHHVRTKREKKTPVLFAFLGVWINLIDKNSLCYIYFGATESDQSLPVFCSWHGNTYYDNTVMVNSNLVICIAIWFKNKKKAAHLRRNKFNVVSFSHTRHRYHEIGIKLIALEIRYRYLKYLPINWVLVWSTKNRMKSTPSKISWHVGTFKCLNPFIVLSHPVFFWRHTLLITFSGLMCWSFFAN